MKITSIETIHNKEYSNLIWVKIHTDEGLTGLGETFRNPEAIISYIHETCAPYLIGRDPLRINEHADNLINWTANRYIGYPTRSVEFRGNSAVDIALWDILGKKTNMPLYQLVGGKCNDRIPVYGYGMMLQKKSVDELVELFEEESKQIKSKNFKALKMKVGIGPKDDLKLVQAVREAIGKDFRLMVDANHAYNLNDALYVGRGLDELDIYWFEEPVAPEDYEGYRELKQKINTNIAGGEAEFTKYGWNELIKKRCIDIAQPEVCGLGGVTEYLKVSALAQANFIPVVNHVWGSAVSIATNLHLLTAQPDMPGGLFPSKSMLEFDTTEKNIFITDLPSESFSILDQVDKNNGFASVSDNPGIGITPNLDFINEFEVNE